MKIALALGHSRLPKGRIEGGAVSYDGTVNEHTFNGPVAEACADRLESFGHCVKIYDRYEAAGYGAAQDWLAAQLRRWGAQAVCEFHFNSANNPAAKGHEFLHWPRSREGKRLAVALNDQFGEDFEFSVARSGGVKPRGKGDGAKFLRDTPAPAVILEPFFGSNPNEWDYFSQRQAALGFSYANAINNWSK